VAEAARRGHEIGVHGDLHQRADEMSPKEFRQDLRRARESVETAAGVPSMSYRAAEWSIRESGAAALRILAAEGFACDASMMPVPPLGPSDGSSGPCRIAGDGWALTEIPPLTGRAFGRRLPMGGAWPFRVLSVKRLAEAEEAFRADGLPAVFTLHPWEIDSAHPAMEGLSPLARTVHFLGLSGWPDRLRRWLGRNVAWRYRMSFRAWSRHALLLLARLSGGRHGTTSTTPTLKPGPLRADLRAPRARPRRLMFEGGRGAGENLAAQAAVFLVSTRRLFGRRRCAPLRHCGLRPATAAIVASGAISYDGRGGLDRRVARD
jgi:peptidoglycan/xylan/chitin deacetylase (PgdA/CDA1 family)